MSVYYKSPTLEAEMWENEDKLDRLCRTITVDRGELRRLLMIRARLRMRRHSFDYTLPVNWLVAIIGCSAMVGLMILLKEIN